MNHKLPEGWTWTTLGALAESVRNGTSVPPKAEQGVPVLRISAVRPGSLDLSDVRFLPGVSDDYAESLISVGDILFTRYNGSRAFVGVAARVRSLPSGTAMAHPDKLIRVRLAPGIDGGFVELAVNCGAARKFIEGRIRTTAGQAGVSGADIKATPVPVPPLGVQRAIVAEIETQFTRLDSAVGTLERVKANLKRARASVLKAAVEGRLVPTEASLARAEGRTYEPASALLDRILADRKAKWPKGRKYVPFVEPLTTDLPPAPEGWAWMSFDSLAEIVGGVTKDQKKTAGRKVPYLRVANVQRGRLDLTEMKTILAPEEKIQALRLRPGDVLLNEGGDRDKLGRGWVWNGEIAECIHQNHVFRARARDGALQPKYLSHYANTQGDRYFQDEGKQTTNLASISLSKVKALPVAVPPPAEQVRIVAEVERRLSVLDALGAAVEANLARCSRLRQSILKRAFEGKLVPQAVDLQPPVAAHPVRSAPVPDAV